MKLITLLVVGTSILNAGAFLTHMEQETIECEGDCVYPIHTIEGYQLIDLEVEEDFNHNLYDYVNDALVTKTPPAVSKEEAQIKADEIQANIDVIEKETILNRGSRELELLTMERIIAPQMAQLNHVTVQQVLDASIYYQKLKTLDTQVSNLRAEMASLWTIINS